MGLPIAQAAMVPRKGGARFGRSRQTPYRDLFGAGFEAGFGCRANRGTCGHNIVEQHHATALNLCADRKTLMLVAPAS